jgi:hypothetical protein
VDIRTDNNYFWNYFYQETWEPSFDILLPFSQRTFKQMKEPPRKPKFFASSFMKTINSLSFWKNGNNRWVHLFWFINKNQMPVTALANTTQREWRRAIRQIYLHNLWRGHKHNRLKIPWQDYQSLGIHYTPWLLSCPFG